MGLFNLFAGKSGDDVARVVVDNGESRDVDLRFRDSPVQNLKPEMHAYMAVVSAVENLLSNKTQIKINRGDKLQQMFGGYLFQGEKQGFETIQGRRVFIESFSPVPSFDMIVECLGDGNVSVIKLEINEAFEFQNVNKSLYPDTYCFAVVGFTSALDALILKDIKGQAHGDKGYVYVTRENMAKINWTGYVVMGVSHGN